jgi:16S rRNA (cytidine1402-2'-O)-methyltransferase
MRVLEEMKQETRTMIVYEAPHHLKATLRELQAVLGDRSLTLCRELTKRYEEKIKTTLAEAISYYETKEPRGEYVLVIAGKSKELVAQEQRSRWEQMSIPEHTRLYLDQGLDKKEAMKAVAKDRGISKRDVYQALLSGDRDM